MINTKEDPKVSLRDSLSTIRSEIESAKTACERGEDVAYARAQRELDRLEEQLQPVEDWAGEV